MITAEFPHYTAMDRYWYGFESPGLLPFKKGQRLWPDGGGCREGSGGYLE